MSQFSVFQAQNQAAITNWLLGNVFKDDLNNPNARYGGDVPPPIGGVTVAFDEAAYVTMEGTDAEVTLDFGNTTAGAIEDTVTITVYDGAVEVNAYLFDYVAPQGGSSETFEFGDDLDAGEYTMVADFFGSTTLINATLTVTGDVPPEGYTVVDVTGETGAIDRDALVLDPGTTAFQFVVDVTGDATSVTIDNFALAAQDQVRFDGVAAIEDVEYFDVGGNAQFDAPFGEYSVALVGLGGDLFANAAQFNAEVGYDAIIV